mmetsp:Transcript_87513/g.155220  ORF Transcript_87513/g.155220 Transcript_87513/m.155220 type:complete len:483 (-) Transcript_87513:71-1519(-)|eukprot:CAMPEP_0197623346 /NCGR_PEP_ID=MMETSP1338-20131121/3380_1 /TAXON_ID=43686 ORGANISM="Pelagodinium beii, Strain RCC1491" /NCGR_SAMPLE_ID=MMETSP1338 /ASSEMBLY_ACC=CAM_ASM_000754 /LENGTH=482 /DNA_ID=CAMNT_0043193289 /DNA_START=81 /DNA_END=1529 /DNA_ORIENTATION=-
MKCKGNRKSKKTKLSLKYNIQKRCREHKRRVKKEAKKLGLKKKVRKDPGIPNSLPWKADLLADIEKKKAKKEEEMATRKAEAKKKVKQDREAVAKESQEAHRQKEAERRAKRAEEVELSQLETLRKLLLKADVLLQVLDARDPLRCRCPELEAWVQEQNKRLIFVISKSDLVLPTQTAQWLQLLGQVSPAVAVQVEAGNEGVAELVQMLGHSPASSSSKAPKAAQASAATAVGVVGYSGTGKRSLLKALRREAGSAPWLLEALGHLRPADDPEGEEALESHLHLAMRGMFAKGKGATVVVPPGDEALLVAKHMLERSSAQALMRRFRLPAFEGPEAFLEAWVKSRELVTKRGKTPGVESAAQRFLGELGAAPGCSCAPPEKVEGANQWATHAAAKAHLEQAMKAQIDILGSRDASSHPSAKGLTLSSRGLGPSVALQELMEHEEAEGEDEDDEDMEDGEEIEEIEEGEEEEDFDDDDAMEDE